MSQQTDRLVEVATELSKNGFPVSAAICNASATRMDAMESLILDLRDHIEDTTSVEFKDLEIGKCYELESRNLRQGVWDGSKFHGIRYKLGDFFMDSEIHYDLDDRHGTAKAIRVLT